MIKQAYADPLLIHAQCCRSYQVLVGEIDYLAVALPGNALPADALLHNVLPSVPEMIEDSLHCSQLFSSPTAPDNMPQQAQAQAQPHASSVQSGSSRLF